MKGRGKKHLHETPAEFAEAYDRKRFINRINGHSEDAILYETEQEVSYRRKELRNMKMPAHRPPSPKIVGRAMATERLYESETAYRKRLAKWYKRYGKGNHTSST